MSLNRRGKESGAFVLISNLHDNENVNGPGIGDAKCRTIDVRIDLCARTKRSWVLFVQTLLPPLGLLYALTKSRFGNDSSPTTSHVNYECNTNRLVVSHFTHDTSYVQKTSCVSSLIYFRKAMTLKIFLLCRVPKSLGTFTNVK